MGELNLGQVITAVAQRLPDRPALVHGEQTLTYAGLLDRSQRFAGLLADFGLGQFRDRAQLSGHEAGQHLLAQYLHNGPAFVEGLVGSYLGRVAPFNVNYRYRADELRYLLRDAAPGAIQYHSAFAPLLAEVIDDVPSVRLLLQVADRSGQALLPGALDYDTALESATPATAETLSSDDLYVIYTGGTTGMPKGVLWRQSDVAVATLGVVNRRERREWLCVAELVGALGGQPRRLLPCAPMMHGAAQWAVLKALCEGDTVVFPRDTESFSARDVLETIQLHHVSVITIVGDGFALPLIEELCSGRYDISSLRVIVSGGAALHASSKQRLHDLIPRLRIIENIGSSESGILGTLHSADSASAFGRFFEPDESMVVIAEDFGQILQPGHEGVGWLARCGRVPLGYLNDPVKTERTFPVVDGRRMSVPGDRARLLADGRLQLLGRDSLTINTGGEKVFAEEVETVLKDHPSVVDALVSSRASARWGSEVVALVVALGPLDESTLIGFCQGRLARYKAPKKIQFVDHIARLATGKPDYTWAARLIEQATSSLGDTVGHAQAAPP